MTRWIGGRQADLAPHGRGGGWGLIGAEDRRAAVRTLLTVDDRPDACLAAAFEGPARGAISNVLAIDDASEMTEHARERLLNTAGLARLRNPHLVWRPVLAALHAIEGGGVQTEGTIAVIGHVAEGVSVQVHRVLAASGRGGTLLAPERRRLAALVKGSIGYASLIDAALMRAVGPGGFNSRSEYLTRAASIGRMAFGLPCLPEVVRQGTGDWTELDLRGETVVPDVPLSDNLPDLSACSQVFLETLTEGPVQEALTRAVGEAMGRQPTLLPVHAVAHGALIAARRFADGDPVYFDFLPKLSTIVLGHDGAKNFELIDADETLPAGQLYRSPKPARFHIPAAHRTISIFLRKEEDARPRKAEVDLGKALTAPVPVALWVEQKPAAGRARITMDASELGRTFTVDWDDAEREEREWDEILDALAVAPPSIPARMVLPTGRLPWVGKGRDDGLAALLRSECSRTHVDWKSLAARLASRPAGQYPISSDGTMPDGIGAETIAQLDDLTERAVALNRRRLEHLADEDNESLKFLTWQFRRCPREVMGWLMDCIESRALRPHPFVEHSASWVLVYQGLGRIISDAEAERRCLRAILDRGGEDWRWRVESATVAFLLSRSDTAPLVLERDDIAILVRRTVADFDLNFGGPYTRFSYAPFLLAGLLRWRLRDDRALLLGHDPLAEPLMTAIERVEGDLQRTGRGASGTRAKKRDRYLPILNDLRNELRGEGSNPDLLLNIFGAAD